jgi:hypothetical protein
MSDRAGLLVDHRFLFPSPLCSRARLAGLIIAFFSPLRFVPAQACWLDFCFLCCNRSVLFALILVILYRYFDVFPSLF